MTSNKKGIADWIGLSFYVCNDIFAWGLMSQVIQIPSRMALYKKERLSGLYGSTAFYLSLWVGQALYLICYPIIVTGLTFYFLGMGDSSFENYLQYILTGFLVS